LGQIRSIRALIALGRPKFLIGGFVMHFLGAAAAMHGGSPLNFIALLWAQVAITSAQLMTHYANDYYDLHADRANRTPTNWSGGSRVLALGLLPTDTALWMALGFGGISLCANLYLSIFIQPGWLTFIVIFTGQVLAWFYSAPPLRLHSTGFGELTTALVVTGLTPLTGYVAQTGTLGLQIVLATLPLWCMQVMMLLAVEFPDYDGDLLVGKRTLVVRIGPAAGARLYIALAIAAYAILPLLVWAGLPVWVAIAAAGTSPLAVWQIAKIVRGDWHKPERWNRLAFYTIVLLMLTGLAEGGAFFLLSGL
jgi:1,4-dihydroxy-2-naphthoate octaprenyltransferase